MVNAHNYYRARHRANGLSLERNLMNSAQNYAIRLARSNSGLVHSGGNYGENLAYQMDSRLKMNQNTCYGKKKNY